VNIYARAAIAAVLVVGVGLVAINVLPRQPDGSGVGGQPTASPSPSASAAGVPELTQTFVSSNNGFSIQYPDDAEIEPATVVSNPLVEQDNKEFDFVVGDTWTLRGSSTLAPDGVSIDDWIDKSVVGVPFGDCQEPRSTLPEITIDGQPGRIHEGCPGEIEATVVVDRRVYLFTLFGDGTSRALFDAYASTIDLRPEEAASPAPS
jgi:hypothetical protein